MTDDTFGRLKEALADRYAIERELGSGGMAMVYLAHDLKHDRKVAIKVMRPELSAVLGGDRFLREVGIAAKLNHPHILALHDSGEAAEFLYYVMPYVEGESLQDRLNREKQLPLADAVAIAREVADALNFAHERNVIHRDIKPGNVLLSDRHAVVADFGIATALDESSLGKLTETGVSIGSPIYMSPEQATAKTDVDGRTDIYALGCMLYEMLAGVPPFEGSLETVVSRKVLGEFRPLRELRPDLPLEIDKAVSKCLSTEPAKRFATAREFSETLVAALPREAQGGLGRKRTMVAAVVLATIVVSALLAVFWVQQRSKRAVWATQQLAELEDVAAAGHYSEALALAREIEAVVPDDVTLARLLPQFSYTVPIRTDPPGARVYVQEWEGEGGEWEFLGVTPIEDVRFAGISFNTVSCVKWCGRRSTAIPK